MSVWSIIKCDLYRYKKSQGGYYWDEPSLISIILYRIGYAIRAIRFTPFRLLLSFIHLPFYILFTILLGIQIPRGAKIGKGLRIYHFGCIIINPDTMMGDNCTIRQGVTIGTKSGDHDVPVIGNNVEFGAGCKVLGAIKIGDNVIIGANAVVLKDVPSNSIAVGVPAKIIPQNNIYEDSYRSQ